MDKSNKKDKEKERKEKELKFENEIDTIMNDEFNNIKSKNDIASFNDVLVKLLPFWNKKIVSDSLNEKLFVSTAKFIELSLNQKEISNFYEKLSEDNLALFIKSIYCFYDRFTSKKNCLSLKPTRIYPLHNKIIEHNGMGLIHRGMFSIAK